MFKESYLIRLQVSVACFAIRYIFILSVSFCRLPAMPFYFMIGFCTNRIYNKILDRAWFSVRLFVT